MKIRKFLAISIVISMLVVIFTSCSKKTEQTTPSISVDTEPQTQYIDKHLRFSFTLPEFAVNSYSLNLASYDDDGNYLLLNSSSLLSLSDVENYAFGVSKYYVNSQEDYDMLRVDLKDVRNSQDIFQHFNYKIAFSLSNHSTSFKNMNIKSFDIQHEDEKKLNDEGILASRFKGTINYSVDAGSLLSQTSTDKSAYITGYAVHLPDNPVLIYIVNFSDDAEKTIELEKQLDAVINTFHSQTYTEVVETESTSQEKTANNT